MDWVWMGWVGGLLYEHRFAMLINMFIVHASKDQVTPMWLLWMGELSFVVGVVQSFSWRLEFQNRKEKLQVHVKYKHQPLRYC